MLDSSEIVIYDISYPGTHGYHAAILRNTTSTGLIRSKMFVIWPRSGNGGSLFN